MMIVLYKSELGIRSDHLSIILHIQNHALLMNIQEQKASEYNLYIYVDNLDEYVLLLLKEQNI